MRTTPWLICCGVAISLTGCGRTTASVAQFAENTRSATERLAYDTDRSNDARERRIAPDIAEVRNPSPIQLVQRYETRQGPDGLFVYDTQEHSVARLGAEPQAGLTQEQAAKAVDALAAADAKGLGHDVKGVEP